LRGRAEQLYPAPPLATPDPSQASATGAVAEYAAVRLFLHRARAVKPDFALTPETASAVAAICRRLDGLPLAIELAAALIRLLPPAALLARLDRRAPLAPLLTDGARDLPERLRTMERAIAWSHDLLDAEERAESLLEACAAAYRALGDPHEPWEALACLACLACAGAGPAWRSRAAGDNLSHVASLFTLATLARRRGDYEGAVGAFAEALRLSVNVGDRGNAAYCLEGVAEVVAEQGQPSRAAWLWGVAAALLATFDPELYPHTPDCARRDAAVASSRARLGLGEGPFAEA